ncbi:MAG: glycosyltransferase family 39 protein [Peptoanaerobacter stomatis]|uniref:glycosyltransferase family 39 protein n=1 Tax=Peptoanaerobacter stomatis TaxID=796937 RepID=UPI003FA18726
MKKFLNKKNYILIILIILNFFVSFKLISIFPQSKEVVTIVATGEKNISSQGNEIWLRNIIVDGRDYEIPKPLNGKWIWGNADGKEIYGWRTYNKSDDITDEIVLEIPVGKNRKIVFEKNIWRGLVEIKYNNKIYIADCYENTEFMDNFIFLSIDNSSKKMLLYSKLCIFLEIFILLSLLFLMTYVEFITIKQMKNKNSKIYYFKIRERLIVSILLFIMFLIMYKTSDASLWGDDLLNIGFTYKKQSFLDAINVNLTFFDITPPLFNIIAYNWIKIAPYGEKWLFLLSEIYVILGIYILYKSSKLVFNNRTSILTVIIATLSTSLMVNGGHEFRTYGLMFMFSSIVLYFYYYKTTKNYNTMSIILFGISMSSLCYSHYHGLLLCVGIFIYDIMSNIKLKKYRFMYSYIIALISYLPWIIMITKNRFISATSWMASLSKPNFEELIGVLYFLVSDSKVLLFIFLCVTVYIIGNMFENLSKNKISDSKLEFLLFVILFTILLCYTLNANGILNRIFLKKFFIIVMPMFFIVLGVTIDYIIEFLELKFLNKKITMYIAISIYIFVSINNYLYVKANPKFAPYPSKEIADYIKNQNDFNNDNVLVMSTDYYITEGFEYLITENGKLGAFNRISESLEQYDKIYVIYCWSPLKDDLYSSLSVNYNLIYKMNNNYLEVYEKK